MTEYAGNRILANLNIAYSSHPSAASVSRTEQSRVLMVQGTASSVGKSLMAAALCRIYKRRGWAVAPFKAQNMSNNAAVCADGSEIGRAQALQAWAAGLEPSVDFNPVLLKPEADSRCQVVADGKLFATCAAGEYRLHKPRLWDSITSALDRLRGRFDLVIIEGAGSPAEINLQADDMVNMAVARYARSPVALVGDVDAGGVFAALYGTMALLPGEDRRLVRGAIINKFRGNRALLEPGLRMYEALDLGLPVLGVVPLLDVSGLPEEDAQPLERKRLSGAKREKPEDSRRDLDIVVIRLPRISNFDDFDPLASEPGAVVRFEDDPRRIGSPDAVILPGTKAARADLAWLRDRGFDAMLAWFARCGIPIAGICGGYQILGRSLGDPEGVEGEPGWIKGLDLLPVDTVFFAEKRTVERRGSALSGPGFLSAASGFEVRGYEIHAGRTESEGRAVLRLDPLGAEAFEEDGCISPDGGVWGVYLHGIFDSRGFRRAWLDSLREGRARGGKPEYYGDERLAALDRLADSVEAAVDMDSLDEIIGAGNGIA